MHLERLLPALATGLVLGCGGASVKAVDAPIGGAPPAAAGEVAKPAPPPPLDAIDPQAHAAARVDVARLRETPLYRAVLPVVRQMGLDGPLQDADRECGFPILDSISELVLSVSEGDDTVAAARLSVTPEKGLACIRALSKGKDAQLDDGTPAVRVGGAEYALIKDGVLYVGHPAAIARASAPGSGKSALAARVALTGDTVVALQSAMKVGPVEGVSGTLRASEKEFWLELAFDLESEDFAAKVLKTANDFSARGAEALGLAPTFTVEGKTLRGRIGMKGTGEEQAHTLGLLGSLAVLGVRKYLAEAKAAEATNTVGEIAKDLSSSVARDKSAHKPTRFPLSAPPVPADVPRGMKYQSTPGDWSATWKDIGFSIGMPQYFRYSIVTAPDRKHAVVRAEGDLDGDGRSSLYEIPLEIDKKGDVSEGAMKVVGEP
jgi:type IV pilus assembly protein PilA